jgi:hypothetical protein
VGERASRRSDGTRAGGCRLREATTEKAHWEVLWEKLRVLGGSESIQGGMVFILLNYHHRF